MTSSPQLILHYLSTSYDIIQAANFKIKTTNSKLFQIEIPDSPKNYLYCFICIMVKLFLLSVL